MRYLSALLALVMAVGVVRFALTYRTGVASGVDSYGYVSAVDLWRSGNLHISQPFARQLPWPEANAKAAPLGDRLDLRKVPLVTIDGEDARDFDDAVFAKAAPLIQTRIGALSDIPSMVDFFFLADPPIDQDAWAKTMSADFAADVLRAMVDGLSAVEWNHESIKSVLDAFTESRGLKLGKTQAPVRVAITGRSVGPPLFESIEILGREESLRRLGSALAKVG